MNKETKEGYALQPGEGKFIDFRGTNMTVKVSGEVSDVTYSLIEMLHPPDVGFVFIPKGVPHNFTYGSKGGECWSWRTLASKTTLRK